MLNIHSKFNRDRAFPEVATNVTNQQTHPITIPPGAPGKGNKSVKMPAPSLKGSSQVTRITYIKSSSVPMSFATDQHDENNA